MDYVLPYICYVYVIFTKITKVCQYFFLKSFWSHNYDAWANFGFRGSCSVWNFIWNVQQIDIFQYVSFQLIIGHLINRCWQFKSSHGHVHKIIRLLTVTVDVTYNV